MTMQISVVIEKLNGSGYCAKTVSPPLLSAIGSTRDAALATLREQLSEQFAGEEIVSLDVPVCGEAQWSPDKSPMVAKPSNPWAAIAGAFKDDPDYAEVIQHMKAYREQRNRELDALVD
jgi:predicted RNase H-like HicB family nuclease